MVVPISSAEAECSYAEKGSMALLCAIFTKTDFTNRTDKILPSNIFREMKGGEMFLGPIESASRGYIGLLLEKMYKEKSYLKREFLIFNLKCEFDFTFHAM